MSDVLMTFAELRDASGALFSGSDEQGGFSSVCIDSRSVVEGSLFVALSGSAHDGHSFVEAAFQAGAVAAMVSHKKVNAPLREIAEKYGAALFAVEDTLKGLQAAAASYVQKFPHLLKIGITGSSGKTTTKEIAGAIIGCEKALVMNQGNLNSETGLPLSVFEVRAWHEAGIFEMGMNRSGEIEELARVLRPHIALITNIGSAHIGLLGGKDAIAAEKKAVFSAFTGSETALIPASDAYRDFLAKDVRGRVVFYGSGNLGAVTDRGLDGTELVWDGLPLQFRLAGAYNVKNALAAIAIAQEAGIASTSIRQGLESVKPLFGRSEILTGAVTVIQDCYNANPESTAEALAFCDCLEWSGKRIYVIGSMFELGERSNAAHEELGRRLAASRADFIYLLGAETRTAADILSTQQKIPFFYTESMQELSKSIAGSVQNGDLVLLKGSRRCALERLTAVLKEALK